MSIFILYYIIILYYKQNRHLSIQIINNMSHNIGNINTNMDKYIKIMFKM